MTVREAKEQLYREMNTLLRDGGDISKLSYELEKLKYINDDVYAHNVQLVSDNEHEMEERSVWLIIK